MSKPVPLPSPSIHTVVMVVCFGVQVDRSLVIFDASDLGVLSSPGGTITGKQIYMLYIYIHGSLGAINMARDTCLI